MISDRAPPETLARLMQQVVRALCYMHKHRVCHRDLKPENFLFLTADPIDRNVLKLIDFGLARVCASGQLLSTKVGTPFYVSPQVWLPFSCVCLRLRIGGFLLRCDGPLVDHSPTTSKCYDSFDNYSRGGQRRRRQNM